MKLAYQAYDQSGGEVTGALEARDEADARDVLSRRGLFVTDIAIDGSGRAARRSSLAQKPGRGGLRHLSMFTRQFYVLMSSGTQVVPALTALEQQMKDQRWRQVVGSVRARVEQGSSLSEAMEAFPVYFDSVYRSMVSAGESGGSLPQMFGRLADLAHKRLHIQSTIRGALAYPVLLITVAVVVLTLMLLFVVPRFSDLFKSLDVALPPSTEVLIGMSNALKSYWWLGIAGLVAMATGAKKWLSTKRGRRVRDTILLRLPKFGPILKNFATARIIRLLGILLEGHVPVLEALKLTRGATTNVHYSELIRRGQDLVSKGEPISASFGKTDLISPSVYETVRSGEQSGQVGPLLTNLANFLDEENEITLRSLTSIIEPLILVMLGLLVGFVAISMFMPLFDLTSMAGPGGGR